MKSVTRIVYSHWDGNQQRYSLEADQALDELSRFLMEGLDLQQSLDWMRYQGFELAGMDFRVMGLEEMLSELRQQARERMSAYNMDETFDERWARLEDILRREEAAQERENGVESAAYNEFRRRRDDLPRRLSQALESFRDHEWADPEAEAEFQEMLGDQQDTAALEDFYARNRGQLQGGKGLSFEEALELMREVEAISRMAQDLLDGNFERISLDQLREMLGEEGAQSIMILRDLEGALERGGYLREGAGGPELTPRAIRRLGELALDDIYASLKRGGAGSHETKHRGGGVVTSERTRPYTFGEPSHLDAIGTLRNALRRGLPEQDAETGRLRIGLEPEDLEVFDTDQLTETTTVLLLDMSWSMSWSGRWPAAKRVAVAMDHLIRTR